MSIIKDGITVVSLLQERVSRIKHDFGLEPDLISLALTESGILWEEVDEVAVTTTQLMPAVIRGQYDDLLLHSTESKTKPHFFTGSYQGRDWVSRNLESKLFVTKGSRSDSSNKTLETLDLLASKRGVPHKHLKEMKYFLVNDPLSGPKKFGTPVSLKGVLGRVRRHNRRLSPTSAQNRQFREVEVVFRGISKPGKFWAHHATHAASNIAFNPTPRPIITHDGGLGVQSGAVWSWTGERLEMVTPHFLELGALYDFFGVKLGLGTLGPAGKLMGLAAYGPISTPTIPIVRGNIFDWAKQLGQPASTVQNGISMYKAIWDGAVRQLSATTDEMQAIGDPSKVTSFPASSLARMMQQYVEATFSEFAAEVASEFRAQSIGVSGGFALNCPTNTALFEKLEGTAELVIEPHCEDGGCSIGSATLSYLEATGSLPAVSESLPKSSSYAYLGLGSGDNSIHLDLEFLKNRGGLQVRSSINAGAAVADLLARDKVVALFVGRSEIGPRALGHRSILANPAHEANWKRLNTIKKRESWRPFAPAVLEEYLQDYFSRGPSASPFMLFNYDVRPEFREKLSAVTHKDGTSRVQTVDDKSGKLFDVLEGLKALGLPPVVLNTSLNGPGEPIVQTVEQAVKLFLSCEIDALLVDSVLLEKTDV